MNFTVPPSWTNTQTIIDDTIPGNGTGDLIAGAVKINSNYNAINTFNTSLAALTQTTITANAATITINQVAVFLNPSANQTITLPQISSMAGTERSFSFELLSNFTVTFQANASDKLKSPYSYVDTATGGTKTLMYLAGDMLTLWPNTTTNTWIITVVRENNSVFFSGSTSNTPTISTGIITIPINVAGVNQQNCFNTSTYTYTVLIPGFYNCLGQVAFINQAANSGLYMYARINGSQLTQGPLHFSINSSISLRSNIATTGLYTAGGTITLEKDSTIASGNLDSGNASTYLRIQLIQRYIP